MTLYYPGRGITGFFGRSVTHVIAIILLYSGSAHAKVHYIIIRSCLRFLRLFRAFQSLCFSTAFLLTVSSLYNVI